MQIRKCNKNEISKVGEFYDKVVKWLDEHINYPRWIYKVYPSENSVKEMVASDEQYLCEENGEIIAAFGLNDKPQGKYSKAKWKHELKEGEYLILHALAIKPEMHQKGIASKIIKFSIDTARAENFKAIRIDVVPSNIPAKKLFQKNGFNYIGDIDLELGIGNIPRFSMFEFNI